MQGFRPYFVSTAQTAELSAVCAVPTLPPRKCHGTYLEAERIGALGHLEIFWNRTENGPRNLPACGTVPQPTAPPSHAKLFTYLQYACR